MSRGITAEQLPEALRNDDQVRFVIIDVDGQLRGQTVSKESFIEDAADGIGMATIVFAFDVQDGIYETPMNRKWVANGFSNIMAVPDLSTFRRIPWEDNMPFVICDLVDGPDSKRIPMSPRDVLKIVVDKVRQRKIRALAGAEIEFYNFRVPKRNDAVESSVTTFLRDHAADTLPTSDEGIASYNVIKHLNNHDYFKDLWKTCRDFHCEVETWHTENGPGAYEAALSVDEIASLADKAVLFKYLAKANGTLHGITPSFMAKSRGGYGSGNLGCSMHIHISLVDDDGKGLFYRETADDKAPYPELSRISDVGRQFLAGLLDGLADCLPMLAPTINSYKRLDKRAFTPVTSSWGLEHRAAAVRIVAPPTASANSTRFEVRVPGADANPHLVLAAILAMGWRGVEKKLSVTIPPLGEDLQVESEADKGDRFPENLKDATERFMRKDGVARELFGEEFVEHFGASRMHEVELWKEAITDWEMRRYVETV